MMPKNRNPKSKAENTKKMFGASISGQNSNYSAAYAFTDKLSEVKYLGKKYLIAKYGSENNQPELWDTLEEQGGWHRACLSARYKFAAGRELRITNGGVEAPVPVVNKKFQTLYDINEMITKDQIKYGGYALEIIWSNDGSTIVSVKHIPWRQVRAEVMDNFGDIPAYWRSQSWRGGYSYSYANGEDKERLPVFDPTKSLLEPKQVLVIARDNDRSLYYPEPDSAGVVQSAYLEAQIKIAKLSFANRLANPAWFLSIPFDTNKNTEDDFLDIVDSIDAMSGVEETGRTNVLSHTPGADNVPQMIAPPKMENQDVYENWIEENVFEIFSHHGILFPEIVGRPNQNTGLGTEDIEAKFQIFVNTALVDTQRFTLRGHGMIIPFLDGFTDETVIEIVQMNPTEGIQEAAPAEDVEDGGNEETIINE